MLKTTVGLCLAFVITLPIHALDIVINHQPVAEIIIEEQATAGDTFAAKDFQYWVKQITGAELPILNKSSETKNTKLFFGAAFANDWPEVLKSLDGTDGFAIRQRGHNLYLFGGKPRSTLYAACALLENNTDIIWVRPNKKFGTVFTPSGDLKLEKMDLLEKPVFSFRGWNFCLIVGDKATGYWMMRNRCNYGGPRIKVPETGIARCLNTSLPIMMAGYAKTNPEFFKLNPVNPDKRPHAFCLTNKAAENAAIKTMLARVREMSPKPEYVRLIPSDTWSVCLCAGCQAPIKLADGTELKMKSTSSGKDPTFWSTRFFIFMSKLTIALKKEYPDIPLQTLAYIYHAEVPVVKPHPDLQILFAPYPTRNERYSLLDEKQRDIWRERYKKWVNITKKLGLYEYYGPNMRQTATIAEADLNSLNEFGQTVGCFAENVADLPKKGCSDDWDLNALDSWVISHLFWNPKQDVEALRQVYFKRAYHEAAPVMKEYHDLLRSLWLDPDDSAMSNCHWWNPGVYNHFIFEKGHERGIFALLDKAEKLTQNPNSKALIQAKRNALLKLKKRLGSIEIPLVKPNASNKMDFNDPTWKKASKLDNFLMPSYLFRKKPLKLTSVDVAHDKNNLYIRFYCFDKEPQKLKSRPFNPNSEKWPKGDHCEIRINQKNKHLFAFDCNGNSYDARNLDRAYNADWKVKTRRLPDGYEGIATIPLDALKLTDDPKQKLKLGLVRVYARDNDSTEYAVQGGKSRENTIQIRLEK